MPPTCPHGPLRQDLVSQLLWIKWATFSCQPLQGPLHLQNHQPKHLLSQGWLALITDWGGLTISAQCIYSSDESPQIQCSPWHQPRLLFCIQFTSPSLPYLLPSYPFHRCWSWGYPNKDPWIKLSEGLLFGDPNLWHTMKEIWVCQNVGWKYNINLTLGIKKSGSSSRWATESRCNLE